MNRPSIRFDKDAIVAFLLAHGEKIGVGVVAALACGLVWGGVSAARTKAATRDQLPKMIEERAGVAAANIQKVRQPPAGELRSPNLAKSVDPWRRPDVQQQPLTPFNKPLFEERSKRSKPDVFPIEELRAVAGVALMPERQAAVNGRNPADVDGPEEQDGQPDGPKRRRKPREQTGQAGQPRLPPGLNEFGPGNMPVPGMPGMPDGQTERGRLIPYCVVTGLIPTAKQVADYRQRYEQAGLRDPRRDVPLWSDFLVERMVVTSGGREDWKRIDLKQFFADAAKQWAGVQGEQLPVGFVLTPEQNPGSAFGYCGPLPALGGDRWGFDSLHPWFIGKWKEMVEEQALQAEEQARLAAEQASGIVRGPQPGALPAFGPPGGEFGPPGFDAGPGMPGMPGMPGGMVDAQGRPLVGLDFRLFRFVDTTVEAGQTYRYRVRLSLWNPNRDLEPKYLVDAALAKDVMLPSAPSNVTEPVTVPSTTALLVRGLRKAESKRLKAGAVEVLVLDRGADTGNYALRGLVTEPGGLINVDKRLNRPGDQRTRGEDIVTDAVLVDIRGRQDDRAESRGAKGSPPPEPLEMLFLNPDGTFALATAAESQPMIDRFIGTLPMLDDPKAGKDVQPQAPGPANPYGGPSKR